eukprot:GHVU01195351.1.p2 GENE.GHVU01195351.1~~GHVU01195351.1.p2  ORF type:complete len:122 (+),score=6.75 GHVU01195351.1:301-666(+)
MFICACVHTHISVGAELTQEQFLQQKHNDVWMTQQQVGHVVGRTYAHTRSHMNTRAHTTSHTLEHSRWAPSIAMDMNQHSASSMVLRLTVPPPHSPRAAATSVSTKSAQPKVPTEGRSSTT